MEHRGRGGSDDLLWHPWQDFFHFGQTVAARHIEPQINMWASDEGAVVTLEIPGIEPGGVDISLNGSTLTVSGEVRQIDLESELSVQERSAGAFARSVELPFAVEVSAVHANYENGVLSITLPRAESDRPKRSS